MDIINPANGETLRTVEAHDAEAVAAAYAAAREAQAAWAAEPLETRVAIVARFRDLVTERAESLARTMSQETGKPVSQSMNELNATPPRIDWFLQQTAEVIASVPRAGVETGTAEHVSYGPLGVVANISAWNYPWFVGTNVFIPALLTGNAVLYKPSEFSTLTGLAMAALFDEAGLPAGLFTTLVGARETGEALLAQPIDGVFFTGSHATGVAISRAVAGRLIPVQLELGGKDPLYVADDVDVAKAAASAADGAFYNAGQSCCAVERVYVHQAIYEPFVEAFVETVKGFTLGDPADPGTYLGPLARAAQIPVLEAQVKDALDQGATAAVLGGPTGEGSQYAPTVLTGVTHDMAIMREESFGPVIGIMAVADDAEAVRLMNDTTYGLTAAVFSADQARAEAMLSQVRSGSAYWNCCDRVSPRLPWTGFGGSGLGSTLGHEGIRAFVQPRGWHLRPPT